MHFIFRKQGNSKILCGPKHLSGHGLDKISREALGTWAAAAIIAPLGNPLYKVRSYHQTRKWNILD